MVLQFIPKVTTRAKVRALLWKFLTNLCVQVKKLELKKVRFTRAKVRALLWTFLTKLNEHL